MCNEVIFSPSLQLSGVQSYHLKSYHLTTTGDLSVWRRNFVVFFAVVILVPLPSLAYLRNIVMGQALCFGNRALAYVTSQLVIHPYNPDLIYRTLFLPMFHGLRNGFTKVDTI